MFKELIKMGQVVNLAKRERGKKNEVIYIINT